MPAKCYLCDHQDHLGNDFREGTDNPVGACHYCSVLACDAHGERGTNDLFICYLCVPPQVLAVGAAEALQMWPRVLSRILELASVSQENFVGMSQLDAANLVRRWLLRYDSSFYIRTRTSA